MIDDNIPPSHPTLLRISGKAIGVMIALGLVAAVWLFYGEEGWRGQKSWRAYVAAQKIKGIALDWEAYIPPPLADDCNFAMIPLLKPIYDFIPGTQTAKYVRPMDQWDKAVQSADELFHSMGFDLGNFIGWENGEMVDLIQLLGTNKTSAHLKTKTTNAPVAVHLPASQEEAAQIIRDVQSQTTDIFLNELFAASQTTSCRFDIKYDHSPGAGILLPHLAVIKSFIVQLKCRAEACLALGQNDRAFDDLILGFYLSDTIKEEPFLVSSMVRLACRKNLTQVIYDGMARHKWSDAQLHLLIESLSKEDLIQEGKQTLLGERAFYIRNIEQARMGQGGVYLDDLLLDFNGSSPNQFKILQYLFPTGWVYFEEIKLSQAFDNLMGPLTDWPSEKADIAAQFREIERTNKVFYSGPPGFNGLIAHHMLDKKLAGSVTEYPLQAFRAQTIVSLTLLACALERYYLASGDYPENLAALAPKYIERIPNDPMSGRPFLYHKNEPKHFDLQSVGANFKEDAGGPALNRGEYLAIPKGEWGWKM